MNSGQTRRSASAEQKRASSLDHAAGDGQKLTVPRITGHRAEGRDGAAKRQHRPMPSSRRRASPRAGGGRLTLDAGETRAYPRIERRVSGALRGHHGEHSHTPEGPPATSPDATARAVSVDKYTFHEAYSRNLRQAEEWPQTKSFLQREIEARSQRISANWHQWQQRAEQTVVGTDKDPARPWRKLIVVCAKLPFTLIWNEEKGVIRLERDEFEADFAEILAAEISEGKVQASVRVRPDEVYLVGSPVVRRAGDRSLISVCGEGLQQQLVSFLQTACDVVTLPVFPPPGRDRFADQVIFPLFHYTPPSVETGIGLSDWEGYNLVNETYRDAVLQIYSRGDLVLINDFPLMLLPKALRKERPDISIGFYIHCVFPSSEVYRILPQREELLRGVLSSNVIGFHNFQYVRHFLTAATRILGCECTANGIEACEDAGGTSTKVIAVPLGIHLEPYTKIFNREETRLRIRDLESTFAGKTILMALDRLEEKEGIPHKIMAFHKFLQKSPSWAERVVFVQLVNQAKAEDGDDEKAREERQLLQQVYQMGGECNSAFGSIGHLPFHFLYQDLNRVDVTALMVKAHVFMDTPLRDTLSREAHEFVWCQEETDCGVLILSEFSGSAQSLRAAAICVNPWDTTAFADAIQEAIEMEFQDRRELHLYGQKHVFEHTQRRWAANFLDEIVTAERECEDERLQIPPPLDHDHPVAALRKASRRIFVFGFSGTLLPRKSKIQAKLLRKLHPVLFGNLKVLAEEPNTHVIVMSSLEQDLLSQAIGNIPCWIIAEGGVCYREPDGSWSNMELGEKEWLAPAKEIMEYFAARTPGSRVIETMSSVSWHYQKTQGDHAAIQSKDLLIHLWAGPLLSAPAEVVVGNDEVSVRPTGVSKASQLEKILQKICCEEGAATPARLWLRDALVLCISDLITKDEDVYVTLQKFFEQDPPRVLSPPLQERVRSGELDGRDYGEESWLGGHDRLDARAEANLEANSKSLGMLYSRRVNTALALDSDSGPFGLHKASSTLDSSVRVLQKMPSEPELTVAPPSTSPEGDAGVVSAPVSLITVTVNRKPTRAMYHVSDTTDVAFLIARLAREIRQAKQAQENECNAQAAASTEEEGKPAFRRRSSEGDA